MCVGVCVFHLLSVVIHKLDYYSYCYHVPYIAQHSSALAQYMSVIG